MDLQLNVGVCDGLGFHNTSNKILKENCRTRLLDVVHPAYFLWICVRTSTHRALLAWGRITCNPDLEPRLQTQMPRVTREPVSEASW